MRTQDQKRANHAYNAVKQVKEWDDSKKSRFKTLALKFPSMVLQCGVLQSLAFYENKQKDSEIFTVLDNWLCGSDSGLHWINEAGVTASGDNAIDRLCHPDMDISCYRLVAREAIAYGTWLKRAAETRLKNVLTEG